MLETTNPSAPSTSAPPPLAGASGTSTAAPATPLSTHDVRPYVRREPLTSKLGRRALTMPLHLLFTALWWALAPVALPILIVADLVRGTPLLWTRFYIMIGLIIFGQSWGLFLLFGCWLLSGFGSNYERNNRLSMRCEGYWADWNVRAQGWVYGIKYHVEGSELLRNGPTLLLVRHTSINDTILPIGLITYPHGVRLRIVLKAELIYAAIVDAIGHRLPVAFIKRSGASKKELDAIRMAGTNMHSEETVMIFPEGTRFTDAKRRALMEKIGDRDTKLAGRARELTHVLPLRLGGTNALIEAAPTADIVICAHTGYENTEQLKDFVNGGLYKANVRVKFWRIPAAQIPRDLDERAEFLHQEWRKVNDFVASYRENIASN
ncbi:MAG TPA: 1-acyl-sn-glycerol-3-phosphate acyltransferase [Kofleriaceae bacterium]|nr:1-acyl-sn-glycerol-3-phosphate acyltransferase [Kofleriaceae bacterium]